MKLLKLIIVSLSLIIFNSNKSFANTILRDVETEDAFKYISSPFLKVLNYKDDDINFFLVDKNNYNAYVYKGKNIFIHSGLILKSKNVEEFMAVMAHELSHIKNGDLTLFASKLKNISQKQIFSTIAAGILGGLTTAKQSTNEVDGVYAGISLASQIHQREILRFNRSLEISADILAFKIFEKAKLSPIGIINVQKKLVNMQGKIPDYQKYALTHPIGKDRLSLAINNFKKSKYKSNKIPDLYQQTYDKTRAKLIGYYYDIETIDNIYKDNKNSINHLYSYAQYYLKKRNHKKGLELSLKILSSWPENPYYNDLVADFYKIKNQNEKAFNHYLAALKKLPNSLLLNIKAASSGVKINNKKSETILYKIILKNPKHIQAIDLLSKYYEKNKKIGFELLFKAKSNNLKGKNKIALKHANEAIQYFKKHQAEYKELLKIINENKFNDKSKLYNKNKGNKK